MSLLPKRGVPGRLQQAAARMAAAIGGALLLGASPGVTEIIWSGDFSPGDFTQWHTKESAETVTFWGMPEYGRPLDPLGVYHHAHRGNGELASIVAQQPDAAAAVERGPVRSGQFAARFTVKNSRNGEEPADCAENGNCDVRRTELWGYLTQSDYYDAIPYGAERWLSASVFLPETHDPRGNDWGPIVFQIKSRNQNGTGNGPTFAISAGGEYNRDSWQISHKWSRNQMPSSIPWQYVDQWEKSNNHAHAAVADFPDRRASEAALGNLNRGGWTDFVIHVRPDADGNGDGFLNVWMHFANEDGESLGDWVHVVGAVPRRVTRGGKTFDRGIFYKDSGGFGFNAGIYTSKSKVWDSSENTTVFMDNLKVGDEQSTFGAMAPERAAANLAPGGQVGPTYPQAFTVK